MAIRIDIEGAQIKIMRPVCSQPLDGHSITWIARKALEDK